MFGSPYAFHQKAHQCDNVILFLQEFKLVNIELATFLTS